MTTPRLPKYRHYKPKDLAVVRIRGRDHYLGRHGSEESLQKYRRLVAEWLSSGARPASSASPSPVVKEAPSVDELILAYWLHAERHYRTHEGGPSLELGNIRDALRPLRRLYGDTRAADFGPKALRTLREELVRSGLARSTVNARVHKIRRAFKWAASHELIPAGVAQALATVEGLRKGRSEAREPEPVRPVPVEHVEATLPHLPAPVAALVRLMMLTGMRLSEATKIRGCDLTPGEPTWEYRPAGHKNAWRSQPRIIPLGPKAQSVLKEFLGPDGSKFLFSPRDAVRARHAARADVRVSKPTPSEVEKRCKGRPGEGHRDLYDRRAVRQAIVRACRRADVADWTPLQLRHLAASAIRARHGLEAAQTVLGHAKADVTQVYAERDLAKACSVMAEMG